MMRKTIALITVILTLLAFAGCAGTPNTSPNVAGIMGDFQALSGAAASAHRREEHWDVCMSVNYLSKERPNGVMFGFLVGAGQQPGGYDLYAVPSAQYMRLRMGEETAKALNREPWPGGIPPYEWIGEQVAPAFGYRYGDDALPIFEYYGYYNPDKNAHEFCYLYVPVQPSLPHHTEA